MEQGRRNKVEGARRKRRYSTQSIRKGMVCTKGTKTELKEIYEMNILLYINIIYILYIGIYTYYIIA